MGQTGMMEIGFPAPCQPPQTSTFPKAHTHSPRALKTSLDRLPQTPLDPKLPSTSAHSHPGPPISRISPTALLHPCLSSGQWSLTFRGRQDDLTERPAPQPVLS